MLQVRDAERSMAEARDLMRRVRQGLQESDEFFRVHNIDRAHVRAVLLHPANARLVEEIERRLIQDSTAVQKVVEEAVHALQAQKWQSVRGIRRRPSV